MAELTEIREVLAAKLAVVVAVSKGQSSAWMLPNPSPPCLQVMGPDEIEYDTGGFGADDNSWTIIVQGFVGFVGARAAQKKLDAWLASSGEESVKQALEEITTSDELWAVRVLRASGYRLYSLPDIPEQVLGAEWVVEVETSG